MPEKLEAEKYAPPPPPTPPEIANKIAELLAVIMAAPPEAIGTVKDILDRGAAEVKKGPLPR